MQYRFLVFLDNNGAGEEGDPIQAAMELGFVCGYSIYLLVRGLPRAQPFAGRTAVHWGSG